MSLTLAEEFLVRFAGLERAYGQFIITAQRGDKIEGKASLVKKTITAAHWEKHLAGEIGVGIVPIRDDATCVFGAIDVDEYDLDLVKINHQIKDLDLPLVLCRSKSGGAHLFLFMSEPAPAELVRGKLMEMAILLGRAGIEVFPKQVRLASTKDFGNWLNMPYFAGADTTRYALKPGTKKPLDPRAFLTLAAAQSMTVAGLKAFQVGQHQLFPEGPPCLQILAHLGFPEGSRNNGLYNMAVFLRKSHGEDGWDQELDDLNQALMKPPLGAAEVTAVKSSVKKKSYEYKCQDPPLCQACNREICLTREFGIQGASGDPGVTFGELLKINTDPPLYIWDVDGERLELTAKQFMNQAAFHLACVERLDTWPNLIKNADWRDLIREKLATLETQGAPDEASFSGRLLALLTEFFITRPHGRTREEMLLKKPYTHEKLTYFRLGDFMQFLDQQHIRGYTERQIWMILRRNGGQHGRWKLQGQELKWWAMPEVEDPEAERPIPEIDEEDL